MKQGLPRQKKQTRCEIIIDILVGSFILHRTDLIHPAHLGINLFLLLVEESHKLDTEIARETGDTRNLFVDRLTAQGGGILR